MGGGPGEDIEKEITLEEDVFNEESKDLVLPNLPSLATFKIKSPSQGITGNVKVTNAYTEDDDQTILEFTAVLYNFPQEFKDSRDDLDFEGFTFGTTYEDTGDYESMVKFFLTQDLNPDLEEYGLIGDLEINNTPDKETIEADVIEIFNFELNGKVVDESTLLEIPGAKIKTSLIGNTFETFTSDSGEFTMKGEYESGSLFNLNISAQGYSQQFISPFNRDNILKSSIGVVELKNTAIALDQDIISELKIPDLQIEALNLPKIDVNMAADKAMNKVIIHAKTVLLPQILTLIAQFGVTKAMEFINKKFGDLNASCPANLDELNKLIEKKNKLTRAINNIYKFLEKVELSVEIADGILTAADIALTTAQATTFIPSTPAGGPPSAPSNVVENARREIKKYKLISSTTVLILSVLTDLLKRILDLLKMLDSLIQGCTEELSEDDNNAVIREQTQLNDQLLAYTQQQEEQGNPVITEVNGFKMDVITVDGETDYKLKRRRAVAKNRAGIIMLKGEASFSSNDQILIDELVFYIQQNDLKAE